MKKNKLISLLLSGAFIFSISIFTTSCGGSKKGYKPAKGRVSSGSGMGNVKHKNKHVWGNKRK